jgi:ATP-dependent helicase/nuclease subunit B
MNRLTVALADACRTHLLEEKWLIAPSIRVGHQWLLTVSRSGQPTVNVHVKTPKSMALVLAGPEMGRRGVSLVASRLGALLIDDIIGRLRRTQLQYLNDLAPSMKLAQAVLRSLEAVRLSGVDIEHISPHKFDNSRKGADLQKISAAYLQRLQAEKLVDYAEVLFMARQRIANEASAPAQRLILWSDWIVPWKLEEELLNTISETEQLFLPMDQPANRADRPPTPPAADLDSQTQQPGEACSPPIVQSDLNLLRWILAPAEAPRPTGHEPPQTYAAVGEVNEVREVLRRCVAGEVPLDRVELLHTDEGTYVPLVYEVFSALSFDDAQGYRELPVTFAEGISCRYSRPGRALVGWLAWIRDGFPQARLAHMIREGVLSIPDGDDAHATPSEALQNKTDRISYARLAATLRTLSVGIGRDRYLPKIEQKIVGLEQQMLDSTTVAEDEEDSAPNTEYLAHRLNELRNLKRLAEQLLAITPLAATGYLDLLSAAETFLDTCARCTDKVDNYARERLVREIQDMRRSLERNSEPGSLKVWRWLFALPLETQVLGSGPREGCLHVAPLVGGGHSGRPWTFIVGMDEARFPGPGLQDPILLDHERKKLSEAIPTAAGRASDARRGFARTLAGLRGHVTFSYSCRDIIDDRETFPSPMLLAIGRLISGKSEGDHTILRNADTVSFAPPAPANSISPDEWWLAQLCRREPTANAKEVVARCFPHLGRGLDAARRRDSDDFTEYDGYVQQAGVDLDPTRSKDPPVMSSAQLELLGKCPLAFFFRHALHVQEPDELEIDPEAWLDPLWMGRLLHEVFEEFIRGLPPATREPLYERDLPALRAILHRKVTKFKDRFPSPSESAFQSQLSFLEEAAHIFLKEEELLCRQTNCRPVYAEVSIGMKREGVASEIDTEQPATVELPNGKRILVHGRVDRIDRVGDAAAARFAIWDYKTGNTFRYEQDKSPFHEGRILQPIIYMAMVGHCLLESLGKEVEIEHFGFFFSSTRAHGQRIFFRRTQLDEGTKLLERLCDGLAKGAFLATNKDDKDCTYCQYQRICGDVANVAAASQRKLANPANVLLQPFRELRTHAEA